MRPNTITWCNWCICASAYNTINHFFDYPKTHNFYRLVMLLKVKYALRFFLKAWQVLISVRLWGSLFHVILALNLIIL
jgi:hypothetical protein